MTTHIPRRFLTSRMSIKKHLRRTISFIMHYSGLSLLWHCTYSNHGVRILTYHTIELEPSNSYSVSLKNFEKQMIYLKNHFNVISLSQYYEFLNGKTILPKNSVVITFDDGFRSFYELAYPILTKYQFKATCFLIASKLESDDLNFMHLKELNELVQDKNMTLASHGSYHKSIAQLSDSELEYEVSESKCLIEKNLGIDVEFFSYPYGTRRDFDERSMNVLSNSRYMLATTSINGINSKRTNPLKLRRTKIEFGDNMETFKRILKGSLDIWILVDYFLVFLENKKEVDFF